MQHSTALIAAVIVLFQLTTFYIATNKNQIQEVRCIQYTSTCNKNTHIGSKNDNVDTNKTPDNDVKDENLEVENPVVEPSNTTNATEIYNEWCPGLSFDILENEPNLKDAVYEIDTLSPWLVINKTSTLECDEDRVMDFFNKYPNQQVRPEDRKSRMKILAMREGYRRLLGTLKSIHIPVFLSHGTLLGWYRQCGFIKFTSDMDFGIPAEHFLAKYDLILESLKKAGFEIFWTYGEKEMGLEVSLKYRLQRFDLFSFYFDNVFNNGTYHKTAFNYVWNGPLLKKMSFPLTTFSYTILKNEKVLVPSNTEDWLKSVYGNGWSTPNSTWDWWTSATFVQETNTQVNAPKDAEVSQFGPNLLIDGSFELQNSKKSWERIHDGAILPSQKAKHGKYVFKVNGEGNFTQRIRITRSKQTTFFFSGWSKPLTPAAYDNNIMYKLIFTAAYRDVKKDEYPYHIMHLYYDYNHKDWQYRSGIVRTYRPVKWVEISGSTMIGPALFDKFVLRAEAIGCYCGNHGECVYGVCHCDDGYHGEHCEIVS